MFERLYEWILNLSIYLIVVAAAMHAVPGKEYTKYVRFFCGLVLILLLFTPVLRLTGVEEEFLELYRSREYEAQKQEIENAQEIYQDADLLEFVPEEYRGMENDGEETTEEGNWIKVEDIRIGE